MIPLELQIKNFLSYGEEITYLDLTHMHTICLSGENGHGKSALLDAITWALWGETRIGKQGHDQLIRIGADEMSVLFTFRVGSDRFRVRRQRNRKTSGQLWELQQDDGTGKWRPLTGINSSDTGKAIQNLLHMSYDTFINSAYLRQGRADEFVRQTANKRKEILCDILDLGQYDALEERARMKAREATVSAGESLQRLNVIEASIAQEPDYMRQLQECLNELLLLETEASAVTAEIENLAAERVSLDQKRAHLEQIDRELTQIALDIRKLEQEVANEEKEIETSRLLVQRRISIVADYERLVTAKAESDTLQQKVAQLNQLDKRRLITQGEVDALKRQLQQDLSGVERHISAIHNSDKVAIKLRSSLEDLKLRILEHDNLYQQRENLINIRLPEAREQFTQLKSEREQIDSQLASLQDRLINLSKQKERCSLCGNTLPVEKIAQLTVDCNKDIECQTINKREINRKGQQLKKLLDELAAEREKYDTLLTNAPLLREQRAKIEQELLAIETELALMPELELERASLKDTLNNNAYANEQIAALTQIDNELAQLDGCQQALNRSLALVKSLADAERQYHALSYAETSLSTATNRLAACQDRNNALIDRRTGLERSKLELHGVVEKLLIIDRELTKLRDERAKNTIALTHVLTDRGRIEAFLQGIESLRKDRTEREKEREMYLRDEEIYKQLSIAFSKQGIQAIIIENALPELEEDANQLLERISDGALAVRILTTRKAKSRANDSGTIETLEINISDNLGTRPLELYSGGESFRVSFALRIALSKLLARRAGANLQTLIIDEGFGTQDGKGREKLVAAINAIADDFEKIIVITHIDELKEAFPTRIDVVKTPLGSQLTVTEGGYIG